MDYDREGQPETVRYQVLPTMLLNEIQRQRQKIGDQQQEINELQARVEQLEALSARVAKPEVSAK